MAARGRRWTAVLLLTACALALPLGAPAEQLPGDSPAARASALRARGLELAYNLDYDEALEAFRSAIKADPADPAAYRLIAMTMWIRSLFLQGAVLADDYLGQARADAARPAPSPELDAAFREHIDRALVLAEARLKANPADADAHFHVGAAYGYLTTYTATVEGRLFGGLRTARRAYREHERAIELDPRRKDAGLVVGMYRYAVSSLSAPLRLLAGIAGFGGGRERGIRLIEGAAAHAGDVQTNALFTLIVVYNREGRYDDALAVIERLQRSYPRNRLLWLEAASTAMRARRADQARRAIEHGLTMLARDKRPRAFGEDARWSYYYGAALVALGESQAAERELRRVLSGVAPQWLRGRAHKELGKLADLAGDRAAAADAYRLAIRVCRAARDQACADEAEALL
ncbi:MAG TPA: tetratricopeptide repeat protein, partial [Vicinamibacterales bacterium]|nr:tetratricopeptide repeat protein [Vicinamibacterales bacterium]